MKQITKEEFDKMIADLAEKNWKVKNLLENFGSYDALPDNAKGLILAALGVRREDTFFVN